MMTVLLIELVIISNALIHALERVESMPTVLVEIINQSVTASLDILAILSLFVK
jgi:hypothetical protein